MLNPVLILLLCLFTFSSGYSQNSSIRIASALDLKKITNANVGDIIISGPTRIDNNKKIILIDENFEKKLLPGQKILIAGGDYDAIWIECIASGTKNKPIIITNYNGQVKAKQIKIAGLNHFKLSGKFDPKSKTGDAAFTGHDGGYAYSQGKYGFFIDNQWQNTDIFLLEITSKKIKDSELTEMCSNFELEYLESGNGGYSNVIKANNEKYISENIKIHDCYIHDTNGEGIYMGNTSTNGDQGIFRNVEIFNNRILRTGLDGLQVVQIGGGTKIHNNVIDGGMKWRSAFMDNQDFGASLSFVSGDVAFYNNIIVNGGNAVFQVFLEKENWYSNPAKSNMVNLSNNLLMFSRSGLGAYLGPYKADFQGITLSIQDNDFANSGFQYQMLHPDKTDSKYTIIGGYAGKVIINKNYWEKGKSKRGFFSTNFEYNYSGSGNKEGAVEPAYFENYSTNGYGFKFFEFWTERLNLGSQKGKPAVYMPGDVVIWKSRIYICTKSHAQIEPGANQIWEQYWRQLKFNNGKSNLPADDVRLKPNNAHAKKGRGVY
jgi:hypothetical protein